MPSILFICPAFPPLNFVATRRVSAMAKYFRRMSWDVTVLTGHLSTDVGGNIMSPEDYALTAGIPDEKVLRAAPPQGVPIHIPGEGYWLFPGSQAHRLYRSLLARYRQTLVRPDIIWATYPCAGSFWTARHISKETKIPWIADFRDLPSQFSHAPRLLRWVGMRRVAQVARSASLWTTVSAPMVEDLQRYFAKRVELIANGFDPELYGTVTPPLDHTAFRMVFTGTPWPGRDPLPIMQAVDELIHDGHVPQGKMWLEMHGFDPQRLTPAMRPYVGTTVKILPFASRHEVVRIQQHATVLLSLAVPGMRGVITGKLPEYLGSGRPILSYPADPTGIDTVLARTGAGRSCNSIAEIKTLLREWFDQWNRHGDIHLERNAAEIVKWSRQGQAETLSRLCHEVLGKT